MTTLVAAGEISPGLLGFLVVALLGLALYLLIRSMNKQLNRIEVPHEYELTEPDRRPGDENRATTEREGPEKPAEW